MVQKNLHGCGVYRILNVANGKFYIGSSIDIAGRWYDHLWALRNGQHYNYRLQADFDEFGEVSFIAQVVELVEGSASLLEAEQWWINDTICYTEDVGYNISPTAGNTLGTPCRSETRAKIGDANRGRKQPAEEIARRCAVLSAPEHKARMAAWHRTVETRSRVSRTKGGTGIVLTFEDVQKAVAIYETGSISIRKLAASFGVGYQQMRNALTGSGPKFGTVQATYKPVTNGNRTEVVALKIARTLRRIPDGVDEAIREKYKTGNYTQLSLAKEFGISPEQVHRIVKSSLTCFGRGVADPLPTIRAQRPTGPRKVVPPETIQPIRELYATGDYTHSMLSDLFGVPKTVVGRIINATGRYSS